MIQFRRIACFLLLSPTIVAENPYENLTLLPAKMHGWFTPPSRDGLNKIIKKNSPKIVVELGSWLGASAIFIAKNLVPDAKLYCVDHWNGSANHQNRPSLQPLLPTLYQQFLSNIVHAGLTSIVIPVKMTTLEAAQTLKIEADLVYVDASHDEASVFNDIMAWYPKLSKNGIMSGDDYAWTGMGYPSVKAAVDRAASILGKKVKVNGGQFWWFE